MGSDNKSRDNILTYCMREALASRSKASFIYDKEVVTGHIADLIESGAGRSAKVEHVFFLPEEFPINLEKMDAVSGVISFHTSSGYYEFSTIATFYDSGVPIIKLESFSNTTTQGERRSGRTIIGEAPISFVALSNDTQQIVGSFELKDISLTAAGGTLRVAQSLDSDEFKLSGRISAGISSLRITRASILRIERPPQRKGNALEYKVALRINQENPQKKTGERRRFNRKDHDRFDLIEISSSLFLDFKIPLRITDLSVGGIRASLVEDKDESLLPIGCAVSYGSIRGEVVSNFNAILRIKWILDSDFAHKAWQEALAKFAEKSIELRSYESQAIFTLLARSGIKSGSYISSYQTAKDIYDKFGEIDNAGNPIVFRALQRGETGNPEAHIGSFKIADNLWFNGDLFSSHEGERNSTKDFVKDYFESFIEFAAANQPYPKIISAWIKGHPYWSKLENSIQTEVGSKLIYCKAAVKTLLPDIRTVIKNVAADTEIRVIESYEVLRINEILELAKKNGLDSFLKAFDFDEDRFGSPLLRTTLEHSGYTFLRRYLNISIGGADFLAITSQMPEGLSPQRHQNSVWIFCLSKKPELGDIEKLVNATIIFSVENGGFPSVIRIVGNDLSDIPEKEGLLVLADPKMWGLAT